MTLRFDREAIEAAIGDDAIEDAMLLGMEHVLDESNRIVPHEFGDLERAGEASADGRKGAVSYESVYAVPQHERLDFKHSPGRRAKFLEIAARESADDVAAIIANALGENL
jgi:hypothetical protein